MLPSVCQSDISALHRLRQSAVENRGRLINLVGSRLAQLKAQDEEMMQAFPSIGSFSLNIPSPLEQQFQELAEDPFGLEAQSAQSPSAASTSSMSELLSRDQDDDDEDDGADEEDDEQEQKEYKKKKFKPLFEFPRDDMRKRSKRVKLAHTPRKFLNDRPGLVRFAMKDPDAADQLSFAPQPRPPSIIFKYTMVS
jgi:hypothetical protein